MARRREDRNVALSDGDNRDKVRGSQKEHINHSTQNESPPPPPLCTLSLHLRHPTEVNMLPLAYPLFSIEYLIMTLFINSLKIIMFLEE